MSGPFSPTQDHAIESTLRACSAVSLATSTFVVSTFLGSNFFQTPINRLIFYATLGNVLANVALMVGHAGIRAGGDSALCQFQAFFLQWFVAADALWSFCMALNVYLTFFRRFSIPRLRKLEWKYFLFCYGMPFILAFVPLVLKSKPYGRAGIWCWLTYEYVGLRMGLLYAPVWFFILLTFSIYIIAGREILANRRKLKRAHSSDLFMSQDREAVWVLRDYPDEPAAVDLQGMDNTARRISWEGANGVYGRVGMPSVGNGRIGSSEPSIGTSGQPSRIHTVEGSAASSAAAQAQSLGTPAAGTPPVSGGPSAAQSAEQQQQLPGVASVPVPEEAHTDSGRAGSSSAEVSGEVTPVPRAVAAGPVDFPPMVPIMTAASQQRRGSNTSDLVARRSLLERHTAAYLYSKRALLFFVALLVTWTPTSVNRIYQLSNGQRPVFVPSYLTAFVIPLQGFWNGVVYTATSYTAVQALFAELHHVVMERIRGCRPPAERQQSIQGVAVMTRKARREKRRACGDIERPREGTECGKGKWWTRWHVCPVSRRGSGDTDAIENV